MYFGLLTIKYDEKWMPQTTGTKRCDGGLQTKKNWKLEQKEYGSATHTNKVVNRKAFCSQCKNKYTSLFYCDSRSSHPVSPRQ